MKINSLHHESAKTRLHVTAYRFIINYAAVNFLGPSFVKLIIYVQNEKQVNSKAIHVGFSYESSYLIICISLIFIQSNTPQQTKI